MTLIFFQCLWFAVDNRCNPWIFYSCSVTSPSSPLLALTFYLRPQRRSEALSTLYVLSVRNLNEVGAQYGVGQSMVCSQRSPSDSAIGEGSACHLLLSYVCTTLMALWHSAVTARSLSGGYSSFHFPNSNVPYQLYVFSLFLLLTLIYIKDRSLLNWVSMHHVIKGMMQMCVWNFL